MQPVLRYQAQTYPPRGPRWPQFDEQLGLVASVTDTLHYGLSQKRQSRQELHSDRLLYHGLAPKAEHYSIACEAGEAPEFEDVMEETQQEEPSRTSRIMAGTKSAIKNYAWPFTKELLGVSGEAAVMAVKHGVPAVAKAVVGGASAVASLASGSDDMVEDTPGLSPYFKPEPDEVEISGLCVNQSQDLDFWRNQSANELRAQITLRRPRERGNWVFKSKEQLVGLVDEMIKQGTW